MQQEQRQFPPLRALRRALVVSDMRHLTHAADALRRSQSALTRSIVGLEEALGVALFERTVTGMAPTPAGTVLFRRMRAAMDHLARAEAELAPILGVSQRTAPSARSLLRLEISNAALFAFLAVCDQRDIRRAADSLGIALATARKSIRELEQQMGTRLFEREPRAAVRLTPAAETLEKYVKRALWEIRAGLDELEGIDGHIAGPARIGVMSTARSVVVPRAIDRLHKEYPEVVANVYWANYADLKSALSYGDIDFIVGALRVEELDAAEFETSTLVQDEVVIAARAEHPLAGSASVELTDLLGLDWILPPPHFQLRRWFRAKLGRYGLEEPQPFIETASLAIFRGSLLESDCVALSTRLQCWHDLVQHGLLTSLPVSGLAAAQRDRPFYLHLMKRAGVTLSPAANALYLAVAETARTLQSAGVVAREAGALRLVT
jgi:LysR family transcriptional regulator of gallate degradation